MSNIGRNPMDRPLGRFLNFVQDLTQQDIVLLAFVALLVGLIAIMVRGGVR